MKAQHIPEKIIAKLIVVMQSMINVHSIYLLGVQKEIRSSSYFLCDNGENVEKEHYLLSILVISQENIAQPKEFMNEVFSKMHQSVKIYSIHYTLNDVKYRLNFGDNFLSHVLLPENELYCSQRLLSFGYCYHPKVYDMIKKDWKLRINRANYFENSANILDSVNDENARMFLLSNALQQASAALLYVFWEFKISDYDLKHQLNLCLHFSNCPKIILPKISFRSNRVFHALCHAQYNLHFKLNNNVSPEDTDYAQRLCRLFLDQAKNEGIKRLQKLKRLHTQSEVK